MEFSGNATVENKMKVEAEKKLYILMNKPFGVVCTKESDSHKTVFELLTPELKELAFSAKRGKRLHTVGRLDSHTTGLLLLTTDGNFSHRLTAPENAVKKTYRVTLEKSVSKTEQEEYYRLCQNGVTLPAEKKAPEQAAAPSTLQWVSENSCLITVTEGKFHEVRRTFLALGNAVAKLERIQIAALRLDCELGEGEWRQLSSSELELLK